MEYVIFVSIFFLWPHLHTLHLEKKKGVGLSSKGQGVIPPTHSEKELITNFSEQSTPTPLPLERLYYMEAGLKKKKKKCPPQLAEA